MACIKTAIANIRSIEKQLVMARLEPAIHLSNIPYMRRGFVYILASRKNGTLYIGVTSDLAARVYAHKTGGASVFTKKYGVDKLVWYEEYPTVPEAI